MVRVFEIPGVFELKTFFLFKTTAVAEIINCYLPYLWLWGVEGIRPTAWDTAGLSRGARQHGYHNVWPLTHSLIG